MSATSIASLVRTALPGPESLKLMARERRVLAHGAYGDWDERAFVAKGATGSLIEDVDGNHFIDFGAGWGTNNIGNCHPEIVEVVNATMSQHGVSCWTSSAQTAQRIEAAEKLLSVCPKRTDRVVFLTTGTEADEAALRIMRRASGRPIVLSFYGQYFGLSYSGQASGSLTAEMRSDVMPLMSGYVYAPYPNPYRSPLVSRTGGGPGAATLEYIEETLLTHEVPANQVAGVIVEPVIGEGGIVVPPDDFLPGLRNLCDKYGWYLCIDEVLSGFGRCGKMWAYENWDVEPDLIVVGKGISGGSMPLAAVVARGDITEQADAYVASTYSGHPAACAAAIKTIEILYRDKLFDAANTLGALALERLIALKAKYPAIGDVRGKGLWVAAEFVKDRKTRAKDVAFASRVNKECLKNGLYLVQDATAHVRIQPPLNIPRPLFEQGLDILADAIRVASGG
jgi:4-aminobutyrate aminotransferase-like enzyme